MPRKVQPQTTQNHQRRKNSIASMHSPSTVYTILKGSSHSFLAFNCFRRKKENSPTPDIPIDPNEPTYCLCNQVNWGKDLKMFSCILKLRLSQLGFIWWNDWLWQWWGMLSFFYTDCLLHMKYSAFHCNFFAFSVKLNGFISNVSI